MFSAHLTTCFLFSCRNYCLAVRRGKGRLKMAWRWCSVFQRELMMPCIWPCWRVNHCGQLWSEPYNNVSYICFGFDKIVKKKNNVYFFAFSRVRSVGWACNVVTFFFFFFFASPPFPQGSRRTWRCRASSSCRTVSRSGILARWSEREETGTSSSLSSHWSSAKR